ncbi:mechanosensitive ion channel protein MscS [Marinobacter vulgaris]|uniref:Mechanosensitive ion channel protein MscS n=1 Tax=Marinobacter vulgaris TaxID=1928331 RepID=A0A2V3ZPM2_9GAMM|nr:mechanosensitive ion channel family protein [Marinobacter vulgaris]PXX93731.1 mechanosensitive ion channel protein MscS [Marinobacter vulgaris]TSJ72253.1 mechanosensitive ion channel family protein [Marinobacter vulgaris]
MDALVNSLPTISWHNILAAGLRILVILVAAWIALYLLRRGLHRLERQLALRTRKEGEPLTESAKRIDTLIRLLRQGIYLVLWIIVVLLILRQAGIDITPLLAGAGIIGLAVGFGAQSLVKDLISGFFFLLENQVRVGDVAMVNGTGGLVEAINFRTIILRDLSGTVHIFPNGSVTTMANMTREWSAYVFELGVAYKEDTDRVVAIINQVGAEMKADPAYGRFMLDELPELFGVDKFGDSAVVIKGRLKTTPIKQWELGREFLRRIKKAFDDQGVEIPFPHRTLYMGDASKPFDIRTSQK